MESLKRSFTLFKLSLGCGYLSNRKSKKIVQLSLVHEQQIVWTQTSKTFSKRAFEGMCYLTITNIHNINSENWSKSVSCASSCKMCYKLLVLLQVVARGVKRF